MRRKTFKNVLPGNVRTRTPEHRNCATENQRRKKTKKTKKNISKRHTISSGYTCTAGGCGPQCRWDGSSLQDEFIHRFIYLYLAQPSNLLSSGFFVFTHLETQSRPVVAVDDLIGCIGRSNDPKLQRCFFFFGHCEFCVVTINRLF